jgi:hypothetical protein
MPDHASCGAKSLALQQLLSPATEVWPFCHIILWGQGFCLAAGLLPGVPQSLQPATSPEEQPLSPAKLLEGGR